MRGGNLKKESRRGVGGEGAAPPPQMHLFQMLWVAFASCVFVWNVVLGTCLAVKIVISPHLKYSNVSFPANLRGDVGGKP